LKPGRRLFRLAPIVVWLCVVNAAAQESSDALGSTSAASEHFAAGSAAFAMQDYRRALTEFQAAIDAGSEGPAVYYNVAVCLYRLGEYARAEEAFIALGRDYPQMKALADYNLGLTLLRRDRNERARTAFERASSTGDDRISALANTMLMRLPQTAVAPSSDNWIRLVELRIGNDDNVALIDPLSLPAGRTTDSAFSELQFYLGGSLTEAGAWRMDAGAFLYRYPDASGFDQSGFYISTRHEHLATNWKVNFGPQLGRTSLDGNGFEQYVGVSLAMQRTYAVARTTFAIELSYDDVSDIESQFAFIDGERSALRLSVDKSFRASRLVASYSIQEDDRVGAGVSADRDRYSLRYLRSLGPEWIAELQYEYRVSDYRRLDPSREESRRQSGMQASREFGSGWRVALRYQYSENDSTDSLFSYRRKRISMAASRVF
jgi:tetratricopeptide (TPR) repeat protein